MAGAAVAKRYARALFELAQEAGELDRVAGELDEFALALQASTDLRNVLTTPGLALAERQALLRTIVDGAGGCRTTRNALLLLTEKGRLPLLDDIALALRDEADRAGGRVRARVTSAAALSKAQEKRVATALGEATGKQVVVETDVDADLIGGVVAQIGGVVYDGSLKTQLRRLKETAAREQGA